MSLMNRTHRQLSRQFCRLGMFALALVISVSNWGFAQEKSVSFTDQVKPILARKCYACHGPGDAESGLRLDRKENAIAETDSGLHAIVPGNLDESELLARITAEDEFTRMPPEGKPLTEEEVEILRTWIAEGAEFEGHWAFEPVTPQEPPVVENTDWVRTPIDAFILGRLEKANMQPNPEASRAALVRRAYYNLTGLPPTHEQIEAFVNDESPTAWENLIDELLASQHYGEKWGSHWLDLVRFAETNSYERDGVKPNAWRYRDYVIRSFNDNKPYDQFIKEQLAGDEMVDRTNDTIIATGYYRLGLWDDEPADKVQHEADQYDDIVSTTSSAFLAMTVACARCHEHKIDPIKHEDYYSFLAFFRGMKTYSIPTSQYEISSEEVISQHDSHNEEKLRVEKKIDAIVEKAIEKLPREERRQYERSRKREELLERVIELVPNEASEFEALKRELAGLQEKDQYLPPREYALAVNRSDRNPPPTHLMMRGNPHTPGEEVQPAFPSLFGDEIPPIEPPREDATTSGRRTVLANWIASPDNRLTARVMVNRIWHHHFGRGIVASTSNFGQLGMQPTHPELLDYLATEFVNSGWDINQMHRLIMNSAVYRMSSAGAEDGLARDAANDLFWRFNPRRLTGEEVRDSILLVNGRFNSKMYGPGFYSNISKEVMAGQSQPGQGWGKSSPEDQARRSVYIHLKRSLITPILSNFDFPETDASCSERFVTTQPAQALGLLNGSFAHEESVHLAKRVREAVPADELEPRIRQAVTFVLARDANDSDLEIGKRLVARLQEEHGVPAQQAFDLYCLTLLNLNEFLFID
ncbi:MAG: PSD1 and planctomycete cytochrome C domain-containing protein [Pirellulaceae bacterium]